ncbi:formyl peptide receptor 2-like, partial [Hippocampus comes]|uniref:formyl peptide receptor 2-like n=1 Tax=Hippocampus comes TaxID=109280 RepID=UPI00094F3262
SQPLRPGAIGEETAESLCSKQQAQEQFIPAAAANVLNVWLVNLAMADLVFCITRIFSLVKKLFLGHWPFGLFICKFTGFCKQANMFGSVFMLAVISVDRALCVRLPVFTRRHRTVCAARVVATCMWVVVLAFSWPFFSKHSLMCNQDIAKCQLNSRNGLYVVRFLFGFLLPFLVILACYILAGVGIHRTRLAGKWRVLGVLALLVATFFLCWAPYHALLILKILDRNCALLKTWMPLARGVAFIKSGINPLLYFFVGQRLRTPAKKSLEGLYKSALADNPDGQTGQSNDNGLGLSKSKV